MIKNKSVLRGILIGILLICTGYLVYSIITDPFGGDDIILALAVFAGFVALGSDKSPK